MKREYLRFQDLPEDVKDITRLFIFAEEGNWPNLMNVLRRSAKHLKGSLYADDVQELYVTIRLNDNAGLACSVAKELGFEDKIDSFEIEYRRRMANCPNL